MTKDEWKKWHERFKEIFDKFYIAEQNYRKGKNKAISDSAERTMVFVVSLRNQKAWSRRLLIVSDLLIYKSGGFMNIKFQLRC